MTPFSFLQVADVHLDSALSSTKLGLPVTLRQERKQEILDSLFSLINLAERRKLDAIIIPGDLFDAESVSSQTINRLIEALMSIPETFVVIAPGNHDYYSLDSVYNQKTLAARGMRTWPENVHIFCSAEFTHCRHPARQDVSFTGRAFLHNVSVNERLLSDHVPKDTSCAINFLLFHGSLDGYTGGDSGMPGKLTAPFSANELASLDFTYAAIGHYHDFCEIRINDRLLGAYSGCLVGRGLDEAGPRYGIVGEVTSDKTVQLEKIELDARRIVLVSVNITGLTTDGVLKAVSQALVKSGARQQDIVYLELTGNYMTGGEPTYVNSHFRDCFWHLSIADHTRPDWLNYDYDSRTVEGKFIETLLQMKKERESAGADATFSGSLSSETIEDALYYGLDALRHNKIGFRHVD